MAYERLGESPIDYLPCRYAGSKLSFRGPPRKLAGEYVAFLGGTDTYGKFIEQPYPALIEARTGVKCVNFGWPNAGVDVFLNDIGVQAATAKACLTVLQVPCVAHMTNRFYTVHPRRNDRFLEASGALRAIFKEVDFTEFHFVRHMLRHLYGQSPERFGLVREEIQQAWLSRMQLLIKKLDCTVVLLWMSSRTPDENADRADIEFAPVYVTREMMEELRPLVADVVEVTARGPVRAEGTKGMRFTELEAPAAQEVLGPTVHFEVAGALEDLVKLAAKS